MFSMFGIKEQLPVQLYNILKEYNLKKSLLTERINFLYAGSASLLDIMGKRISDQASVPIAVIAPAILQTQYNINPLLVEPNANRDLNAYSLLGMNVSYYSIVSMCDYLNAIPNASLSPYPVIFCASVELEQTYDMLHDKRMLNGTLPLSAVKIIFTPTECVNDLQHKLNILSLPNDISVVGCQSAFRQTNQLANVQEWPTVSSFTITT